MAGAPERLSDHLGIWTWFLGEGNLNSIQQPERSRIAQPGVRTSLDEPPCGSPVAEPSGIGQRAAATQHRSGRLDIGSRIEQRIKHGDVIAACSPVQWRLGMKAEPTVGTDIGASRDQTFHHRRTIAEVPGPVGGCMQQRPIALLVAKAGRRKPRMHSEEALERIKITSLYGRRGFERTRIVGGDYVNRRLHVWLGRHGCQRISVA